jgi:hypothetical protein
MPKTNQEEIQEVIEVYNALAESYDELFRKTIPLFAQAVEDELLSIREKLIGTGFTGLFPQYLVVADNITLEALEQYEAGDYYEARETAVKAMDEYEILLFGANVFLARQEIIYRGFVRFDEENFSQADEIAQLAIEEFDSGNRDSAIEKAEEALLRYNLVISNAWVSYAAEKRQTAIEERELALADRANIASREFFRDAETHLNQAEENFIAERFHDAGLLFIEAEALYIIARQDTNEKRQRAETALRTADERVEESNEAAIEAERIIEGGLR